MTFYCRECDLELTPVFGDSNLLEHERQNEHERCSIVGCEKRLTKNRRIEHDVKFHEIKCAICSASFRSEQNLKRHVAIVHKTLECVLCRPQTATAIERRQRNNDDDFDRVDSADSAGNGFGTADRRRDDVVDAAEVRRGGGANFRSVDDLRSHARLAHGRNDFWFCKPCSRMFATEGNHKRHANMAHRFVCVYCARRFGSGKQLKSHIATDHNEHPCYFCGAQFESEKELYEHQKRHCRQFCCDACDKKFDTLVHYNAHRSKHFGKLGVCSTSREPSLRRFHSTWNEIQYEHEPWEADCDTLLRGAGEVQKKVQRKVEMLRGTTTTTTNDDELHDAARLSVREEYIKRLQQEYMDNLKELVNHVVVDREDGEIRRITVNLVQKVPFEEQLERALREIFAAVRHQVPYKLVLAFGFLLYKRKTDELWTFYVNEHLSRDPTDKKTIHQLPNVWEVHDREDEDSIIDEMKKTDFFTVLQNQLDQHGYDVMMIRITNIVAEVFPTIDAAESYSSLLKSAVHDGNEELEGRGYDDDDDDDDDEDYADIDGDLFLDQEATVVDDDDDDDNDQDDEADEDDNDGDRVMVNAERRKKRGKERDENEDRIDAYVKRHATKRSTVLYSGKMVMEKAKKNDTLQKMCFFIQMAFWHLRSTREHKQKEKIKKRAIDYFRLYCRYFEIDNDEEFTGVNVKIMDNLEYLFKTRINVFVCTALEKQSDNDADDYLPVMTCLHLSNMSNSYDNKYGTLNLLLHKNHYYTILDRNRFLHHRLKCYGCETTFSRLQNLARHMKNVCGKQMYCYARGSLQAHENVWAKAKRLFGISDALLSPEMQDEPLYWTRHYVTFDFEALLKSVKQSQLNSWDAEVGMDVEERLLDTTTTTVPVDDGDDDDDGDEVLVNIPLSYAIATNFACCDNDDDDENVFEKEAVQRKDDDNDDETMYCERDKTGKYFSLFRMARNPRRLVARFVADLMKMADCRRRLARKEYAPVLAHVERWFEERGLTCRLQTTCQFSECVVAQSGGGDGKKEDVLMEIYKDEIATVRKLKRHLEYMPVIGFNSSGYDLPLIKKYLYDVCLHDYRERCDFHFIKKNSKYVSLTIKDELRSGGLVFLDTCSYLAAGIYSLDTFIKAFLAVGDDEDEDDARKSYFPYEYVNAYEKLGETHMPPYESFFSTLTQSNRLEDELQTWRLKNHCFFNDNDDKDNDDDDDKNRPTSGREKYRRLCEMWEEKGFRTLGDFLRDYNLKDVRPFLRSVENYALQLREQGVDEFRDGISLPGLAKAILSHTIPPNTFYYIDNAELYMRVHKNEVGGQSIIFKRENELPYVKGYDANALYLASMCGGQFVGRPLVYQQVAGSVMVRTEMSPSSMRLTEERRLRDLALGVGAEGGPIRIGERRDSREARLFLDYLDRCVLTSRRVVLHRQKYLRLCRTKIDLLQGKYAELFGNDGDELRRAPHFFVVDGMFINYEHDDDDDDDEQTSGQRRRRREQRCVIEFEGCYWHACTREESKCANDLRTRRTRETDVG
eukprot:gene8696-biopygen6986